MGDTKKFLGLIAGGGILYYLFKHHQEVIGEITGKQKPYSEAEPEFSKKCMKEGGKYVSYNTPCEQYGDQITIDKITTSEGITLYCCKQEISEEEQEKHYLQECRNMGGEGIYAYKCEDVGLVTIDSKLIGNNMWYCCKKPSGQPSPPPGEIPPEFKDPWTECQEWCKSKGYTHCGLVLKDAYPGIPEGAEGSTYKTYIIDGNEFICYGYKIESCPGC